MSFLTLPKGIPDFSKAVISLWFRVPNETMQKTNRVSLIMFGKPQEGAEVHENFVNLCGGDEFGEPFCPSVTSFSKDPPYDLGSCSITVNCRNSDTRGYGVVEIWLQTKETATATGINCYDAAATAPVPATQEEINAWKELAQTPGSGWLFQEWAIPPEPPDTVVTFSNNFVNAMGISDLSNDPLEAKPEFFVVKTLAHITPDSWHHLLLSFDLSEPISTSGPTVDVIEGQQYWNNVSQGAESYAKMWYAIDDVDYRGRSTEIGDDGHTLHHMGPYSVDYVVPEGAAPGGTGDPNGILTPTGWLVARNGSRSTTFGNQQLPRPVYNFAAVLPVEDAEFGIPATARYVDAIALVEMAEFQMWAGVTLDTGIEANRRAFLDYERDVNGTPIKGKDGNFTLLPVDPVGQAPTEDAPAGKPAPAEELLRKKPEILLHGSNKWISGENTGTTGLDYSTDPPTVKPSGQFQPTGGINAYTPDPSLSSSASSTRRKAGPVRLAKMPADARL
jgi:hypothetical protein